MRPSTKRLRQGTSAATCSRSWSWSSLCATEASFCCELVERFDWMVLAVPLCAGCAAQFRTPRFAPRIQRKSRPFREESFIIMSHLIIKTRCAALVKDGPESTT